MLYSRFPASKMDTEKFSNRCIIILMIAGLLFRMSGPLSAQDDDLYFESIAPEMSLSQMTVACILQDSKGFMWFGTADGLNRFDGYRFEIFKNISGNPATISNNYINGITEDSRGRIWIATHLGLNCYDYKTNLFTCYPKTNDNKGISHNKASFIYRDKKNKIWIGTEQGLDCLNEDSLTFVKRTFNNFLYNNRILTIGDDSYGNLWIGTLKGLVLFNQATGKYQIFRNSRSDPNSLSDNHVRTIFEDSNKNLWIGTSVGLNLYDPKKRNFLHFGEEVFPGKSLTNNAVRCIVEDSQKNLLIGTNEGLNIFNLLNGDLRKYNQKKMIRGNLNHFFIYSLYIDRSETVWIGTFSGGINYFNLFTQQFRYFNPGNNLVFGTIGGIIEHRDELWIATGGGGLLNYDNQLNYKGQYLVTKKGTSSYASNVVRSVYEAGNLLLVSTEENRFLLFDPVSRRIAREVTGFRGNITDFFQSSDKQVWLCVSDTFGLRRYDQSTSEVSIATYTAADGTEMYLPYTTCMAEESPEVYWVGTRYVGLYLYDKRKGTVKRFLASGDSVSLRSNYVTSLYIDSRNNLWVGTNGGGLCLFNRGNQTFKSFSLKDGLQSVNILKITEDSAGFIWFATLSGISRLDPTNGTITNYMRGNGFPIHEMGERSFAKLSDGRIIAGGNNGFTLFDPLRIKSNSFIPPVQITSLRLLRSTRASEKPEYEKKYIDNREEIHLKYNQSSFIIEYTGLNYIFPEKNQYANKLEGFDNEWNNVGQQRIAIYTNLNSGTYTFRVKASNNDGVWNEEGTSVVIKIAPPPWKTWWAFTLYFLFLSGIFVLLIHYLKLESEVRIKQMAQENMEKEHQLRIRLFTNFSHELRTPLTLILGPMEDLLNRTDLILPARNSIELIRKNAHRLLFLVNQLMDFRKQESGNLKLKAAEGRINRFIAEVAMAFNELAVRQRIEYAVTGISDDILLWFDRALLENVFFNLLSNAFKNTPVHGKISVMVKQCGKNALPEICPGKSEELQKSQAENFVEIAVSNTGKGIPPKELEKIFDPFYQVAVDGQSAVGTGIGLSLVKGITELHHGVVCVESTPGESAIFRVFLPLGKAHLKEEEILKDYLGSEHTNHYLPSAETYEELEPAHAPEDRSCTILVVDDNADIRQYVRSQLEAVYLVITAGDGNEGLDKAVTQMPDLIISDIMMPGIDGLQLCSKLKNNIQTSHIPVILLTARTTFLQVKEGFEVGADDYITKPFSGSLLRLKVDSVIRNRGRLKQSYRKMLPFELSSSDTTSLDKQFLEKVRQIIDKNISNPDFNIEHFSDEIGLSRASLYRKIKALTNLSPNEFIKNYRLQVAVKYLRETDLPISEISYKLGFNDPAYFANCFKKEFKVSPTKYLQNLGLSRKK